MNSIENKRLNILVVGAGMYTCGRRTDGFGTIMPAILEWKKKNGLGDIYLAATSAATVGLAKSKIRRLASYMGLDAPVTYFPALGRDERAYRVALRTIRKPACVIVAVPDHLHKKVATDAIDEGLHTLVVKPLAPTVREVRELMALQEERGVYCAVEFHKRLDLANLKLKEVISQKKIGEPLYFLVEFSQRKSIPTKIFKRWIRHTNIFQYLGVHYVDIIYFATGATPRRVMATGQKNWLSSRGINTYDAIQAVIEWAMPSGSRFVSHILTNWIDPEATSAMSDQKIKVIGTEGRFESDQKDRGIIIVSDSDGIEEPNPYFCSAYGKPQNWEYRGYGIESIHQFLDDVVKIEEGTQSVEELEGKRPTFRDSLIITKVIEAAAKSLKNDGGWVEIK